MIKGDLLPFLNTFQRPGHPPGKYLPIAKPVPLHLAIVQIHAGWSVRSGLLILCAKSVVDRAVVSTVELGVNLKLKLKNNIITIVYYVWIMRLVIDNFKSEHYNLLAEMAKTLKFKGSEIKISEDEEDAYLLAAMEEVKDETTATAEEVENFKDWLRTSHT